jgi:hypothetical protein
MKNSTLKLFPILIAFFLAFCKDNSTNQKGTDINLGIPAKFIDYDYIELDKIERISKFRSGIGHDYHDDFETCRSMKHYYQPKSGIDWSTVKIFSPVDGKVVRINEEWAGTQVHIECAVAKNTTIIIFHIALLKPLSVGESLQAGQHIGYHIGSQTMSDIAVSCTIGNKWQLISYFDEISDSLFQRYVSKGISNRSECIISKEARDTDPLNCNGDAFSTEGTIPNWIVLK